MPPVLSRPRARAATAATAGGLAVLSAAGVLAVAGPAAPAAACSCALLSPGQQAERADVIFVGTVTDSPAEDETSPYRAPFRVDRIYRGSHLAADVDVASPASTCALSGLREGATYLVFADQDADGALTTDACSTRLARPGDVGRLEAAVGPGWPHDAELSPDLGTAPAADETAPAAQPDDRDDDPADGVAWSPVAVGAAVAAGLVLLAAVLLRRSARRR